MSATMTTTDRPSWDGRLCSDYCGQKQMLINADTGEVIA